MPFTGNNFVRNQNFVSDRNSGPPDDLISADKVDNELDNIADGLTTVKTAAATADSKAATADAKAVVADGKAVAAEARAVQAEVNIRDGVEAGANTLAKLLAVIRGWFPVLAIGIAGRYMRVNAVGTAWESRTPAQTRGDIGAVAAAGDTMTGTLAFNKTLSSSNMLADLMQGYGLYSDNAGTNGNRLWLAAPDGGQMIVGPRSGPLSLAQFNVKATSAQVNGSEIWTAATFNPATKLNLTGGALSGDLQISKTAPRFYMTYPGVRGWSWTVNADGRISLLDESAGSAERLVVHPNGNVWAYGRWLSEVYAAVDSAWAKADDAQNNRIIRDSVDYGGLFGGDSNRPFFRKQSNGAYTHMISTVGNQVFAVNRKSGYIEFNSDIGIVGCNYFVSDERAKQVHGPATKAAVPVIDALAFIDFNYSADGFDKETRHEIGFSAQKLQEAEPTFVTEIGDYLSPNPATILPYLAKAVQELSERVKQLEAR